MSKVVVIGGGAAGMMASIIAARNGHTVTQEPCFLMSYIYQQESHS